MSSLTLTELLQLRDPKFGEVGFTGSRGFVGSSGFTGFTGSQGLSNNATIYNRTTITATAGQTTFSVLYTVGFVDVWLNGVKLSVGTDFTATNGTSIVLTSPAVANDAVEIISFQAFDIANALAASNNLSDVPNAATARTNLGLAIGTNVLAHDNNLQSFVNQFTLPTTDGTVDQALQTDGFGNLIFKDVVVDINGGATTLSSPSNVVLTSDSKRVQAITFTGIGNTVTLPDATTLDSGGPIFIIENKGSNQFAVKDNSGSVLAVVGSGQIASFNLLDNTTQAGEFSAGSSTYTGTPASDIFSNTIEVLTSSAVTEVSVAKLTDSNVICVFRIGTVAKGVVLSFSNGTITAGSTVDIDTGVDVEIDVTALTPTKAIVIMAKNTPTLDARVLSISGTSITVSAQTGVRGGVFIQTPRITRMSDDTAMVAYLNASNNQPSAIFLTVSGTSISLGGTFVFGVRSIAQLSLTSISSSMVIAIYRFQFGNFDGQLYATALSVSGTTITKGTDLEINQVNSGRPSAVALSSTKVLLTYAGSGNFLNSVVLDISGTTITKNTIVELTDFAASPGNENALTQISATQFYISYLSNGVNLAILNLANNVPSLGNSLLLDSGESGDNNSILLGQTEVAVIYRGASNFLRGVVADQWS